MSGHLGKKAQYAPIGSFHYLAISLVVAMLLLISFVASETAHASEGWPATIEWKPVMTESGQPLSDPSHDFPGAPGQPYLDFVDGPSGSPFAWHSEDGRLYLRMTLRSSPLHAGHSYALMPMAWFVFLNTVAPGESDHDHLDYAIVIEGGIRTSSGHGTMRVTYADRSTPSSINNVKLETGNFSSANSVKMPTSSDPYRYIYWEDGLGYTMRLAPTKSVDPQASGNHWYLEFFVPIEWFAVDDVPPGVVAPKPITNGSKVRLAFATSTQANDVKKDLAGFGAGDRVITAPIELGSGMREPAQLVWFGPDQVHAGETASFSLQIGDIDGEPVSVSHATTVSLSVDPNSSPFYADPQAQQPLSEIVFQPGESVYHFYYKETKAGQKYLVAQGISGEAVGSSSHNVTVLPGSPSALAFTAQPADAFVNETLIPVVVQIQDAYGNGVSTRDKAITLSLECPDDGELLGTLTVKTDSEGKAVFDNLNVTRFGVKQLKAMAMYLEPALSQPFNIFGSYLASSVYVSAPDSPVSRGSLLTYSVWVHNSGNWPAEQLEVEVDLPDYVTVIGVDEAGPVCRSTEGATAGSVRCHMVPVGPGETSEFRLMVKVDSSVPDLAQLVSEASVNDRWNQYILPEDGPLLTVVHAPVIQLDQQVWPRQLVPGDIATIEIHLSNTGHGPATDVLVQSRVPSGVLYETGSVQGPEEADVQFQHEEGGAWFSDDVDDNGAPVSVVAIRWIVPQVESLTADEVFIYRAFIP